jgi:hypothetical protein
MIERQQELGIELATLLNRYSVENESGTPDFILSAYLISCLNAFNCSVVTRREWFGGKDRILQGNITEYPAGFGTKGNNAEFVVTDKTKTSVTISNKDDREAKRIACIAESMNIIRTLNSHNTYFSVRYSSDQISFTFIGDDVHKAKSLFSDRQWSEQGQLFGLYEHIFFLEWWK